jgi:hypothetical protein
VAAHLNESCQRVHEESLLDSTTDMDSIMRAGDPHCWRGDPSGTQEAGRRSKIGNILPSLFETIESRAAFDNHLTLFLDLNCFGYD